MEQACAKLKFHALILSILTGRKISIKILPNGATVSKKKLDDGRTAEIYVDHGEYKCRIFEKEDDYDTHSDVHM